MNAYSQFAFTCCSTPVVRSTQREPLEVVRLPPPPAISVCRHPSMLSAAWMRSTRYCDIDFSECVAADQHHDTAGEAGEVKRGLPGRVRSSDDVDVVALGARCIAGRRAVEHTASGQLGEPRRLEQVVGHAGRDDHSTCLDLAAVVGADRMDVAALFERRRTLRASTISAPRRRAWVTARWERSEPLRPFGKPR